GVGSSAHSRRAGRQERAPGTERYRVPGLPRLRRLPDLAALDRVHRRSRLALERLGEGREIRQRTVDPEIGRRMGIYRHEHAQVLRREDRAPALRETEEEQLVVGETGDVGRGLAVAPGPGVPTAERGLDAAEVRDVLAERQLAVDGEPGQDRKAVVEVGDAARALLEARDDLGVPPFGELAVLVELAPVAVEAVGQLVAHHHADGAVVHRLGELLAEE